MSNAKLLEKAFNQAVKQVDISRVHPELNRVIIKTGMQAYGSHNLTWTCYLEQSRRRLSPSGLDDAALAAVRQNRIVFLSTYTFTKKQTVSFYERVCFTFL